MIIGLSTTSTCQLKCLPCAINVVERPEVNNHLKDMDTFKDVIKRMLDFGMTRFNFTPTVGDPFTDMTMCEKLEWVDDIDAVERINMYTNFLNLNEEQIKRVISLRNIKLRISCYGCTEEEYDKYTQTSGYYPIWEDNLKILKDNWKNEYKELYFYIRNSDFYLNTTGKVKVLIKVLYESHYRNIKIANECANNNFGGLMPFDDYMEESIDTECQHLHIGTHIFEDGSVSLCGVWDAGRKAIIGNIFKQSFDEIYGDNSLYQKILEEQKKKIYKGICFDCDDKERYEPYCELY